MLNWKSTKWLQASKQCKPGAQTRHGQLQKNIANSFDTYINPYKQKVQSEPS